MNTNNSFDMSVNNSGFDCEHSAVKGRPERHLPNS